MTKTGDYDITRRAVIKGLGATIALGALAPLRATASEDWSEIRAAAVNEGKPSFYHNLRPQGVEQLLAEFRKANPGIQSEKIRLGSAPLIERFATDNAGRNLADVMLTYPDDAMFAGVDKGVWGYVWSDRSSAGCTERQRCA